MAAKKMMPASKLLSIDIGSKNIHIIEGSYYENILTADKAVGVPTPSNSVHDGKIEDMNRLVKTLRECIIQHQIKTKKTIITINSTSVFNREFSLPVVQKERLSNMVKYELEQSVPTTVKEDCVIEYKVLKEYEEGGEKRYRIRAAAMPKDMADGYYGITRMLKLKPIALDIHSNAISKFFQNSFAIDGRLYDSNMTAAVIDMGYATTSVNIISKGILEYGRLITYGGRDLDKILTGYYKSSQTDVENKKTKELRLDKADLGLGLEENTFHPIKEAINQWITEIQKVFQYYTSRSTGNSISAVYLHGGSSEMRGLPERMKQALNISIISKMNNISCISLKDGEGSLKSECFINAAGAMLRLE